MYNILVINPGSTSTKVAVYQDETPLFTQNIEHGREALASFKNIIDQFELRRNLVLEVLAENGLTPQDLSAVIGRGGLLPPVESGAYEVNSSMIDQLRYKPAALHAANLGAIIADSIAQLAGVKSYIYDPVTVDEMLPITRITGVPAIPRRAMGHNLNMRAMALRHAREKGLDYHQLSLIVSHMGGGCSLSLHHNGRIIDMISDDEGPFSPERAGCLPAMQLANLTLEMGSNAKAMHKFLRGQTGLFAWLGTSDAQQVEKMIQDGNTQAALVYEAMALTVAKSIAKLSVVVDGRIDGIILTGGVMFSKMFTEWVTKRVKFIAPVFNMPGENEMSALAEGALRVLRGQEVAKTYISPDFNWP